MVAQAKTHHKQIGFMGYEIKQRVQLQVQEEQGRNRVLQLSLQSECSAARADLASHEQLRRRMYTFAFKREISALQATCQTTGSYQSSNPMPYSSNPMSYDEYVLHWDALVGGMEPGGEVSGGPMDGQHSTQNLGNLGMHQQTNSGNGTTGQGCSLRRTEVLLHMHHGPNPTPGEGGAWDDWVGGMELGGEALGGNWDGRQHDGRERGSRPKKKRKRFCHTDATAFEFQHAQQGPNLGPVHSWWRNSEGAEQGCTRHTPHLEFKTDGCPLGSSSGGRDRAEGQSGGM